MEIRSLVFLVVPLVLSVFEWARAAQPVSPLVIYKQPAQVELEWKHHPAVIVEQSFSLNEPVRWQPVPDAPSLLEDQASLSLFSTAKQRFFRLHRPMTTVSETSPLNQEKGVAVIRETIVRFSAPLSSNVMLQPSEFYAEAGGRRLLSRIQLGSDRRSATLFCLEPLPGNSRVRVTFDGSQLRDFENLPVDMDGDGQAGGTLRIAFDTLTLTPIPKTAVIGRVLAAEKVATPGTTNLQNKPLPGVIITVDGMEENMRAVTDDTGRFKLSPVPAGRFFVKIDGRASPESDYPNGTFYPYVGKSWEAVAGVETNLAGGTGEIFLPLILPQTLQAVSLTKETVISMPDSIVTNNPAMAGVSITVPPNSLYSDDGNRGGMVGITPVPPDRLPGPLPPGLELPVVITVQTDGPGNFDIPAPVCFPNLPDPVLGQPLPPGTKQSLVSFNHKKGVWESVGSMTVSPDGKYICTDPGVGILQPGWHGTGVPAYKSRPRPPGSPGGGNRPGGGGSNGGNGNNGGNPGGGPGGNGEGGGGNGSPGGGPGGPGGGSGGNPGDSPDGNPPSQPPPCPDANLEACLERNDNLIRKCLEERRAWSREQSETCNAVYEEFGPDHPDTKLCAKQYGEEYLRKTLACRELGVQLAKECQPCTVVPTLLSVSGQGSHRGEVLGLANPNPSLEDQIGSLYEDAFRLLEPYIFQQKPIPAEVMALVRQLYAQADSLTGKNANTFLWESLMVREQNMAANHGSLNQEPGNAPDYPISYVATVKRPNGFFYIRGQTGPYGQYEFFVPRDGTLLSIDFYDAQTRRHGTIYPNRGPVSAFELPNFYLFALPEDVADTDQDGLPDAAELVYGTAIDRPDTDNDSALDGVEVERGSNPLDGMATQPGVITAVDTPGNAVDIALAEERAVVADSEGGLTVFDLSNPFEPIEMARYRTTNQITAVAHWKEWIAAAEQPKTLLLATLEGPQWIQPAFRKSFKEDVLSVAFWNSHALAGAASGELAVVDLAFGETVEQLQLNGAVMDLAVQNDVLYAITPGRLHVVSLQATPLTVKTNLSIPGTTGSSRRHRLSVAGNRLYTTHVQGFNAYDISQPLAPVLAAHHVTTQFGWKQIVPTESGLAVAAVGLNSTTNGPHNLYLADLGADGTNYVFLGEIETSGITTALRVWKGLAWIADGRSGLQVAQIIPYDSQRRPPTIQLALEKVENGFSEGQTFEVVANARDDAQISSVEFYINNQLAARAASYPYQIKLAAPWLQDASTTFQLRAKAIDTGGNAAWSSNHLIGLSRDTQPPLISDTRPGWSRIILPEMARNIRVKFNEPINWSRWNDMSFGLRQAGPDGVLGNGDDVVHRPSTSFYRASTRTSYAFFNTNLPSGPLQLITGPGLYDYAGNALAETNIPMEILSFSMENLSVMEITNTIDRAGASDSFRFAGRAGQVIYMDEVSGDCTTPLVWKCADTNGNTLFEETLGGTGCGKDVGLFVLTNAGPYVVSISGKNKATAPYSLKLWNVPAPQTYSLQLGDLVQKGLPAQGAGEIETPGTIDLYQFEATAGTTVYFDAQSADCTQPVKWKCQGPNGTILFDQNFGGLGCGRDAGSIPIQTTGLHQLTIYTEDDWRGIYQFRIDGAGPTQEFPISLGATVSPDQPGPGAGRLEKAGAKDEYLISLEAGQEIQLEFPEFESALAQGPWKCVDPAGRTALQSCFGCGPQSIRATANGVYRIIVGSDQSDKAGTYQLKVTVP